MKSEKMKNYLIARKIKTTHHSSGLAPNEKSINAMQHDECFSSMLVLPRIKSAPSRTL